MWFEVAMFAVLVWLFSLNPKAERDDHYEYDEDIPWGVDDRY